MQQDVMLPGCAGEVAAWIRSRDGSASAFGPLQQWPQHLRAAMTLMLAHPAPMALMWGPRGLLLYNDAYAQCCGERHPALLGRPVAEAWPEAAEFHAGVMEQVLQGRHLSYHDHPVAVSRDGQPGHRCFDLHFGPVYDGAGHADGVLAVLMETAPPARAQERLHQSQKMEAIGKLTGGVAHDFNNVLQVINGNLHLLRLQAQGDERMEKRLRAASSAVAKGARLAAQLLAFAQRQPLEPEPVDIGRLVASMGDTLRRMLGQGVELRTCAAAPLWIALVDSHQLENAILSLATNARDAMGGDGELRIASDNVTVPVHFLPDMPAGDYVTLAMSDNGCGMTANVASHAIEPFFTTKPAGQGAGLGLSMVHGFVRQSGGYLRLDTAPGCGTRVTVFLPRHDGRQGVGRQPVQAGVRGGHERVLVVEDDDLVREAAVDLLRQLGYRVRQARDPDAALALLEAGACFDAIFTDVVMPGKLKSTEFVERARGLLPGVKVLYTSGYTADALMRQGRLTQGVALLHKPYGRDGLARKLRQVLDGPAAPTGTQQ